ncbi:hypothetical protein H0A70_14905 [Alcaligenaceae bacterium]|nr:hypothetical protein [Alcaligenaceae bacterium]
MAHDPITVWKEMKMKVWPERYWLIDLPPNATATAINVMDAAQGKYCALIRDQTGYSILVDDATWTAQGAESLERQKFGPLKVISTDGPLPFDVTGFIKAALEPINGRGFKAAPQCGAAADHFFTGEADIDKVVALFESFTQGFSSKS